MSKLVVYTDGSTRPTNPGPSGYGAVSYKDGVIEGRSAGYIGDGVSNNQAEYAGMIAGLRLARAQCHSYSDGKEVIVRSDSKLVINQVLGTWVVRNAQLGPLHAAVLRELKELEADNIKVTFEHVRGHQGEEGNEEADRLAGQAVIERVQPSNVVMKYIEQSQDKSRITKKGNEKLYDDVVSAARTSCVIIPLSAGLSADARALLNQGGHDKTSSLVLQFSRLAVSVEDGCANLIAFTTGFKRLEETVVRTMDYEAFQTVLRLGESGYNVIVIHRPHSNDKWMTDVQMGWGGTGREVPAVFQRIGNLTGGQVFRDEGWPPFVELKSSVPWRTHGE